MDLRPNEPATHYYLKTGLTYDYGRQHNIVEGIGFSAPSMFMAPITLSLIMM